jgi:hypothetical protein
MGVSYEKNPRLSLTEDLGIKTTILGEIKSKLQKNLAD